jgi:hypothetical protein
MVGAGKGKDIDTHDTGQQQGGKPKHVYSARLDCRWGDAKSTPEHLDELYAMHRANHTRTLNYAKSLTNYTPRVNESYNQNCL